MFNMHKINYKKLWEFIKNKLNVLVLFVYLRKIKVLFSKKKRNFSKNCILCISKISQKDVLESFFFEFKIFTNSSFLKLRMIYRTVSFLYRWYKTCNLIITLVINVQLNWNRFVILNWVFKLMFYTTAIYNLKVFIKKLLIKSNKILDYEIK